MQFSNLLSKSLGKHFVHHFSPYTVISFVGPTRVVTVFFFRHVKIYYPLLANESSIVSKLSKRPVNLFTHIPFLRRATLAVFLRKINSEKEAVLLI